MNQKIEIIDGGKNALHAAQGEMFWTCGHCNEIFILTVVSGGGYPLPPTHTDTRHVDYNGACGCGAFGVTVNYPDDNLPFAEYSFIPHESEFDEELDDDGVYYGTLVIYDVYEDEDED